MTFIVITDEGWYREQAASSPTGHPLGYVTAEALFWGDHLELLLNPALWWQGEVAAPEHSNCRCTSVGLL